MEKFVLTKEILHGADDYVPLNQKSAWVDAITPLCVDSLKISIGENSEKNMPDMYMVSYERKARYMMTALVRFYLHLSAPSLENKSDVDIMSAEDYDYFAGGHIVNQIERMKSDAELRDKCFDLLSDYKDLYKRLSTQIDSILSVQNDSVVRQNMAMDDIAKELPGALHELIAYAESKEKTEE